MMPSVTANNNYNDLTSDTRLVHSQTTAISGKQLLYKLAEKYYYMYKQ